MKRWLAALVVVLGLVGLPSCGTEPAFGDAPLYFVTVQKSGYLPSSTLELVRFTDGECLLLIYTAGSNVTTLKMEPEACQ